MSQILCTRRIILSSACLLVNSCHSIIALFYLWFLLFLSLKMSLYRNLMNCIGSVIVNVLEFRAVDRAFQDRLGQTKHYLIGNCCFSAKHAALRRNTDLKGIRLMFSSGAICLPKYCCLTELALRKSNSACWSCTSCTSLSSH